MTFSASVLGSLLASIIFWLGLGGLFWLLTWMTEKRLRRFFGLHRSRVVEVHLSNTSLNDPPTSDRRGIRRTLSLHESWAGAAVTQMFQRAPMRMSEMARGLVDALWLRDMIQTRIQVGEGDPSEDCECLIVVGGTTRNLTRRKLVESESVRAAMDWEWSGTHASSDQSHQVVIKSVGTQVHDVSPGHLPALIERRRNDLGQTVISCVGQRADGTWLALEFLLRTWRSLDEEFGDRDFVLVLSTPDATPMPTDYIAPKVLARQSFA